MKKALITMFVMFAFTIWPFGGIWQLLSGILGGGVQESFSLPDLWWGYSSFGAYCCLHGTYPGRDQIAQSGYKSQNVKH